MSISYDIYHSNMTFITIYYDTSIPAELRCFTADFGRFQHISVIGCISVFLVTHKIFLSEVHCAHYIKMNKYSTEGFYESTLVSISSVLDKPKPSMPTYILVWGYMYPQGLAFGGTS